MRFVFLERDVDAITEILERGEVGCDMGRMSCAPEVRLDESVVEDWDN